MTPSETVTRFIQLIEARDLDGAVALLADDVEYDNVPMEAVHGPDQVRTTLSSFLAAASQVEWVVKRQSEAGALVWNERVDRFLINDRWIEIPVAGLWEVDGDGRIRLWRDYFDLATFTNQMS